GGDGAGVDQQFDFRPLEFIEHGGGLCLLIAYREQRMAFCGLLPRFHFNLSISAMAAARARIFASCMKLRKTSGGSFFAEVLSTRGRSFGSPPCAQVVARAAQASSAFGG